MNHETQTEIAVEGMTCNNCARHVREAIQGSPGVASATVQLDAGRVVIHWQGAENLDPVFKAITEAGFEAHPLGKVGEPAANAWSPLKGWRLNVILGLACTISLALLDWSMGMDGNSRLGWISFLLAAPVQILCGARFYVGAWRQLKSGQSNMDTLVSLGSSAAFGYSAWALFSGAGGHLYFMEAAAIITLISIGHWMESFAAARAESSLRALMNLAPPAARRRNADGSETSVPVAELRLDDLILLKPGDRVPADGQVIEGATSVDEATLTGESMPVEKRVGDNLFAGTANLNGQVCIRLTATGEGTALAHIIAAVTRAQNSRAGIQRIGDRVSSIFVPIVAVIAILTALWWGLAGGSAHDTHAWLAHFLWHSMVPETALAAAFIQAAAVLIVACPCAMGLATPMAIMAGTNAAARKGILIRDGIALERAGVVSAIIFDKTGTLTIGKPTVARSELLAAAKDLGNVEPLELAAALARGSSHPVSIAIAGLGGKKLDFEDWQEIRGSGVQARWNNAIIRLGSLKWLRESGCDFSAAKNFEETWSRQAATIIGLAFGEKPGAIFAIKDSLKPGAKDVVRRLSGSGLKVFIMTGDNKPAAMSIGAQLGVPEENIFAEVKPEQKAEFINRLQKQGARVAFVGDGINDAPALEASDLGIAVSRASDVAREAADIILLKSEIGAVPEALELARATLRTIKQNLFWAFFYNVAAIPLAALGFMSPVLCALSMGLSDLIVIGNALRLLARKK